MITLRWSRAARKDMNAIREYLWQNAPAALPIVHTRIITAAKRLQQFPRCGRIGQVEGTRELIVTHAPYTLVYTIEDTHVSIVRVMHQAQSWPPIIHEPDEE